MIGGITDQFRAQSLRRIDSGNYLVKHEAKRAWFSYHIPPRFRTMMEDFLGVRDIHSHVCLKPRQAKMSTLWSITALDWLLYAPGFEGNWTAQRDSKDRDMLWSHVGNRIEEMHRRGRLWGPSGRWRVDKHSTDAGVIQIKKDEIVAHHIGAEMGKLDAEDPRSMNPWLMVMSEAGVLEETNPETFREIYEGIVALKFARSIWETTIKGVGEQFGDIYWAAKEETAYHEKHYANRRWPADTRKAWFWGWYEVESNRRELAFPDEHLQNHDVNIYLQQVDRELKAANRPGLDAKQWNFFRHQLQQKFFGDFNACWYQFPSRDTEAFKATVSTRYLLDSILDAEKHERVGVFPADEKVKCVVFFDLGNESGMVWGQPDSAVDGMWRIPLSLRMRDATADDCLDIIERRRIPVALLMLPHDGLNRNKVAHNLTGRVSDEAPKEHFEKRIRKRVEEGNRFWREVKVDTMGKPGKEEFNISTAKNIVGRVNFDRAGNRESLLDSLKHTEAKDDKRIVKTGEAGRASHLHDAFVLLCRFAEANSDYEGRQSRAEDLLRAWKGGGGKFLPSAVYA